MSLAGHKFFMTKCGFPFYFAPLNNQCLWEGTEHKIKTTCSTYTKSVSICHDWHCLLTSCILDLSFWQQFVHSRPETWKEISLNIWLFHDIKVLTLQLICFCAFNVLFHLSFKWLGHMNTGRPNCKLHCGSIQNNIYCTHYFFHLKICQKYYSITYTLHFTLYTSVSKPLFLKCYRLFLFYWVLIFN